MRLPSILEEPRRIDEPAKAQEYADVLSEVAEAGRAIIVRRNGADLAAVIPLALFARARESLQAGYLERLAATIKWEQSPANLAPPQAWLDQEQDNPCEPENAP